MRRHKVLQTSTRLQSGARTTGLSAQLRGRRAEVVGTNPPLAGFDATKGDNDWALVLFSRSELKDETPPWLISPGDWSAVEAIDPRQWC